VGDREGGPTGGVDTIASTPRQGRGVGPGIGAILDDVKRRRESTLVPRPRQALDGSQYGGTQPTDISRINRRCYWSRSCPAAGSHSRSIGCADRASDLAALCGPLMGGGLLGGLDVPFASVTESSMTRGASRRPVCLVRDFLTNRSHIINGANEPRAALTGSHKAVGRVGSICLLGGPDLRLHCPESTPRLPASRQSSRHWRPRTRSPGVPGQASSRSR
jgi:hypothetical protein